MIRRGTRSSNNGQPTVESGKPLSSIFGQTDEYAKFRSMRRDKAYLDKAREYLDANDYKACAIYLQTAFETIVEDFCETKRLPVRYRRSQR